MRLDEFRIANQSDATVVSKLVNAAYRPSSGSLSGWTHESELVAGDRTDSAKIIEAIANPNSVIVLGIKNGEVIACVHIEKEGCHSHIGMLAVNPVMQNSGIGKQMIFYAEKYATGVFNSTKFIMVVLSSRSKLISFYLRCGYYQTGVVMDYPLSVGAGTPRSLDLKIEILEKVAPHYDS